MNIEEKIYKGENSISMPNIKETGNFLQFIFFRSNNTVPIKDNTVPIKDNTVPIKDNKNIKKIKKYLQTNNRITNKIGRKLTNYSDVGVKKIFTKLVKAGIIEKHGENRGRYYTLKNKINTGE